MRDFLDRLLGRDDAPAIRPLIPSLFETFPEVPVADSLPMGTFSDTGGPMNTSPAAAESMGTQPDRAPVSVVTAAAEHRMVGTRPSRSAMASPPMPDRTPLLSGERSARPDPAVVPRNSPEEQRKIASTAPPMLDAPHREAPEHPAPNPDPVAVKQDSSSLPRPETVPARSHPVSHSSVPLPPPPARTSREPDVHISIGRVEVRATPAPQPSERKSATANRLRLTLDDYLRARAGGDPR